jgi:hypothetical protein
MPLTTNPYCLTQKLAFYQDFFIKFLAPRNLIPANPDFQIAGPRPGIQIQIFPVKESWNTAHWSIVIGLLGFY